MPVTVCAKMPLPTMHLRAPQGKRTCVVIRASLLSEVVTRLFNFEGSKLKRPNQKKVTKDQGDVCYLGNTVR